MASPHVKRSSRVRVAPWALAAVGAAVGLSACGPSTPVHLTGLIGIGATTSNWNAAHPVIGSGDIEYGPTVDTGDGVKPTYTEVNYSGGHVTGWVMAFPAATTLAVAERRLSHDLPADVQQTSSSRQTGQGGATACEVVSYQSLQIKLVASGDPDLSAGRIAVSFYALEPSGSISTSYAKVNRAVVGLPRNVPNPTCPS